MKNLSTDTSECKQRVIQVNNLSFGYSGAEQQVLSGLDLEINDGEFSAVVGPNGAGKSTLLRLISGYLQAEKGQVLFYGEPVDQIPQKKRAQKVAFVRQSRDDRFDFTVHELVTMGRIPHLPRGGRPTSADREKVESAIQMCNLEHLAERSITLLSGGERQRAALAKALAQEPEILLLDEPTAHLDIHYQVEILDLLTELNTAKGTTVLMVLHDLNLAAQYCSRLHLLGSGSIRASGPADEVLTVENISSVYGTDKLTIIEHPETQKPMLLPG